MLASFQNEADEECDRVQNELTRNASLESSIRKKKRKYVRTEKSKRALRAEKQISKKKTKLSIIARETRRNCCMNECLSKIPNTIIQKVREWFHKDGTSQRSEFDKRDLVKEILSTEKPLQRLFYKALPVFSIPREQSVQCVCAKAMKGILGISNSKWNACKNPGDGVFEESTYSGSAGHKFEKDMEVTTFLQDLQDKFAECLPNHQNLDLPSNFTLKEILRMLHVAIQHRNKNITISRIYLRKIWKVS